MTTEDIEIANDGSWVKVEITTTQMTITNMSGVEMRVRFGDTSTSKGFILNPNDTVIVDTDVYISAVKSLNFNPIVAVTR